MTTLQRVLREKRRLVVLLAVLLLVNAGLYVLAVYPLGLKAASAEARSRAAAASVRAAEADFATARATVTGKERADRELRRFYREILPEDLTGARRITYARLAQLAEQSNLRPARRTMDEPRRPAGSPVNKLNMTMTLAGEYRDIRRFIHALETAPEFVVIEDITLTQAEERTSALSVTLRVATYYWAGAHGRS